MPRPAPPSPLNNRAQRTRVRRVGHAEACARRCARLGRHLARAGGTTRPRHADEGTERRTPRTAPSQTLGDDDEDLRCDAVTRGRAARELLPVLSRPCRYSPELFPTAVLRILPPSQWRAHSTHNPRHRPELERRISIGSLLWYCGPPCDRQTPATRGIERDGAWDDDGQKTPVDAVALVTGLAILAAVDPYLIDLELKGVR